MCIVIGIIQAAANDWDTAGSVAGALCSARDGALAGAEAGSLANATTGMHAEFHILNLLLWNGANFIIAKVKVLSNSKPFSLCCVNPTALFMLLVLALGF